MKKNLLSIIMLVLMAPLLGIASLRGDSVNISGTWSFSVDLESGQHGGPTFTFKQDGEKLTGTYTGPLGEQKVTGNVKGNKAWFGFEFTRRGQPIKVLYQGTIEASGKMNGTIEFSVGEKGKWTATKKSS